MESSPVCKYQIPTGQTELCTVLKKKEFVKLMLTIIIVNKGFIEVVTLTV